MGLVILVVVGAMLGWLATIVLRIEDGRTIGMNIAGATVGSLIFGLVAAKGSFLAGISATALLWAAIGAIVAVFLFRLVRQRALR